MARQNLSPAKCTSSNLPQSMMPCQFGCWNEQFACRCHFCDTATPSVQRCARPPSCLASRRTRLADWRITRLVTRGCVLRAVLCTPVQLFAYVARFCLQSRSRRHHLHIREILASDAPAAMTPLLLDLTSETLRSRVYDTPMLAEESSIQGLT